MDLKQIISEEYHRLLNEQKDVIAVDVILQYPEKFSFYGNVINQIRAIPGITVVKADVAGVFDVGPDQKGVLVHFKFIPDRPLQQYIFFLKTALKNIHDHHGEKIISTQLKTIPRKIEEK